jgi:RNase P/RNase MRP subunit POP5
MCQRVSISIKKEAIMAKLLFVIGSEDVSKKAEEVGADYVLRVTDYAFGDFVTATDHHLTEFWNNGIVPTAREAFNAVVSAVFDHSTVDGKPALWFLASAKHDVVAVALPYYMMPHSHVITWVHSYAKEKGLESFDTRNPHIAESDAA